VQNYETKYANIWEDQKGIIHKAFK